MNAALEALGSDVAPKASPQVRAQIERLPAHIAARRGEHDAAEGHWNGARQIVSDAMIPFDAAVLALEMEENLEETRATACWRRLEHSSASGLNHRCVAPARWRRARS